MNIEFPSEIRLDGFLQDVFYVAAHEGNVMLEPVLADELHELLQVGYLCDGDAAVHAVGVVGDAALAHIALDAAARVVGGDAEEGEVAFRHLGVHGTERAHLAERAAQHAEGTELQVIVAHERPREVAAVGAHALVAVLGEVVVPVGQGGSIARCQPEGEHGDGSGDVGLAGAGDAHVTEHAHGDTRCAAIVLLQRVPALQGEGVDLVRLHPALDGYAELGLYHELLLVGLWHLGIAANGFHFRFHFSVVVGNLLCGEEYFRQVGGYHRDARALQELLARPAGVESQGARANLSDAAVAQGVDHAAHGGELVDVFHEIIAIYGIGVEACVGEGDAVLVEVVAHRYLAAEGVASAVEVHLVVLVVACLHEYGHVEFGAADGVDDSYLEAEIGQRDNNAVDFLAMLTEEVGALHSVLECLDGAAARGRGVLGKNHILVALLGEDLEKLCLHVLGKC